MHPQLDTSSGPNADAACNGTGEHMDSHDSGMESDDDDDMDMEPLLGDSDEDFFFPSAKISTTCMPKDEPEEVEPPSSPEMPRFQMSLRQRRMSKSETLPLLNIQRANQSRRVPVFDRPPILPEVRPRLSGRQNWKRAFAKLKLMGDPWKEFHIDKLEPEFCIRHRYNALKKQWVTDDVVVKMQKKPFNHGAMRECFRVKKISNILHHQDWAKAQNYVAKRYMQDVENEVYFEDVVLQMDAKLWGEEYNRHNPPKKVDIFQLSLLELKDRPGKPLYHLEHFIEGEYIKYNSNSGFVDEKMRLTPHAFSHFTFERSGHQLIVVDIQGVGDLYTDPQIHTHNGTGYGDGNLGTRGMALFFYSHVCNSICESLTLSSFDLAQTEVTTQKKFIEFQKCAKTVVRGNEEMCQSPSPQERIDIGRFIRTRTISSCSTTSNRSDGESDGTLDIDSDRETSIKWASEDEVPMMVSPPAMFARRQRCVSESEGDTLTQEEERQAFAQAMRRLHRPSCITHEMNLRNSGDGGVVVKKVGDSILGKVHHEMMKYHEAGRFVMNDNDIDWEAAVFHEEQAAKLGIMEALVALAKLHLGLPRDFLGTCSVKDTEAHIERGFEYLMQAAKFNDVNSMIQIGKAFENGYYNRPKDWGFSAEWYERAMNLIESQDLTETDEPIYQLKAKVADMYKCGGHNLKADPQKSGDYYNEAAEGAAAGMKGRLATKYYILAEEAYAELEEE